MFITHKLYQRIIILARHRHAGWYLCLFSFLEAFILPVSPMILQVPVTIAKPRRAWRYVLYAVVGSFFGGIVGYLIGHFVLHLVLPHFQTSGYYPGYLKIKYWIAKYGVWIVFLISLSPTPYKITTIASGLLGIPFWLFLLMTFPARLIHFGVIAYLMSHKKMIRVKRFIMRRYGVKKEKARREKSM